MRILLTVHQYFPDYITGTEVVTRHVAAGLRAAGHDVRIFTGHPAARKLADEQRFDEYTFDSIPVTRFHHAHVPMGESTNVYRGEYSNPFLGRHFHAYLQRFQPDLVHILHLSRLSSSVIDACAALRIPMVYTATDFWAVCPTCQLRMPDNSICAGPRCAGANCVKHVLVNSHMPKRIQRLAKMPDWVVGLGIWAAKKGLILRRSVYGSHVVALSQRRDWLVARMNKIDRLLVLTKTLRGVFIQQGVEARRIIVLPHGVDASGIQRTDRRGLQATLQVGFLGQISEHKGCHLLIEAVRSLPNLPVTVRFHGNLNETPAYRDRLLALAQNDPRISFCGPYNHQQIDGILRDLDVIVVPSIWYENTPLVIYEAFAAGCPVIASNFGGMAEMVKHEQDGLLFEKGNVSALAQALTSLAQDRAKLRQLAGGVRAPKRIQDYVGELEGIYREVCARKAVPESTGRMVTE